MNTTIIRPGDGYTCKSCSNTGIAMNRLPCTCGAGKKLTDGQYEGLLFEWSQKSDHWQKIAQDEKRDHQTTLELLKRLDDFLQNEDIFVQGEDVATMAIKRIRQLKIDIKGFASVSGHDEINRLAAFLRQDHPDMKDEDIVDNAIYKIASAKTEKIRNGQKVAQLEMAVQMANENNHGTTLQIEKAFKAFTERASSGSLIQPTPVREPSYRMKKVGDEIHFVPYHAGLEYTDKQSVTIGEAVIDVGPLTPNQTTILDAAMILEAHEKRDNPTKTALDHDYLNR